MCIDGKGCLYMLWESSEIAMYFLGCKEEDLDSAKGVGTWQSISWSVSESNLLIGLGRKS